MARISNSSRSHDPRYTAIREASAAMHENNDCSVVAIAAACDVEYSRAHAAMASEGRRPRRGAYNHDILNAVAALGFTATFVPSKKFIIQYPGVHSNLKGVTTHHMERFSAVWDDGNTYLLFTSRHVGAVVDGVNVDWTKGTAKRVLKVYKITKS